MGLHITATGVTPDIVLEIFFIICFPYTCRGNRLRSSSETLASLYTVPILKEVYQINNYADK